MKHLYIPLLAALFVVGCSQPEAKTDQPTGSGTTASMETCADCGKQVAVTDMVAHGDKKVCKECEKLHGH